MNKTHTHIHTYKCNLFVVCLGFLYLWSTEKLTCSNSFLVMSLSGFPTKSDACLLKLFSKYLIWWESLNRIFFPQTIWKNSLTELAGHGKLLVENFNYRFSFFIDVECLLNSVFLKHYVSLENYKYFNSSIEVWLAWNKLHTLNVYKLISYSSLKPVLQFR